MHASRLRLAALALTLVLAVRVHVAARPAASEVLAPVALQGAPRLFEAGFSVLDPLAVDDIVSVTRNGHVIGRARVVAAISDRALLLPQGGVACFAGDEVRRVRRGQREESPGASPQATGVDALSAPSLRITAAHRGASAAPAARPALVNGFEWRWTSREGHVSVVNAGTSPARDVHVDVYVRGTRVARHTAPQLGPGRTLTFSWRTYDAALQDVPGEMADVTTVTAGWTEDGASRSAAARSQDR